MSLHSESVKLHKASLTSISCAPLMGSFLFSRYGLLRGQSLLGAKLNQHLECPGDKGGAGLGPTHGATSGFREADLKKTFAFVKLLIEQHEFPNISCKNA